MKRFLGLYLILAFTGLTLLNLDATQPLINLFCLGLANISWGVIHIFDSGITLNAAILRHGSSGFALEVTNVCSALPVSWLLCAAVLSFPAPWKMKSWAVPAAFVLIQALNTVRIISLVYFGDWFSRPTFEVIHESVWPLVLTLLAVLIFAVWLMFTAPRPATSRATC